MQRIELIGHIGQDAEVKDFNSNQVINFNVAVSETFTKAGVKTTETTWYECAKWSNSTAIAQYLKKGQQVYISGKPKNRAWQKEDMTLVIVNGINVFEIELLGSKAQSPETTAQSPATNFKEEEHDDLPF